MSAARRRVLNLRGAEPEGSDVQVFSDRLVLTLRGNPRDYIYRHVVHLHIEWRTLPWIMRRLWVAWWKHKAATIQNLEWIEGEIKAAGVKAP